MTYGEAKETAIRLAARLATQPMRSGERRIDVDDEPHMIVWWDAEAILEYMHTIRPNSNFRREEVMGGFGIDLIETLEDKPGVHL